ncbi:MAG: SRPBCC family protein [Rhodoferax sp.]|nr:MAG: SRPBCC family protein [Rhodoferax sp.]
MSLTIDLHLAYEFDVKASAKEAFALLSDVPRSASHYPKLAHLEDLGKNAYRWEMEPVGSGPVHVQTVYASKYVANKSKGTVTWTPVAGEGNARVAGSWTITEHPGFTRLVLEINGSVDLPLPGLMKSVAEPIVEFEFESLTEQYIDAIAQTLGGEA